MKHQFLAAASLFLAAAPAHATTVFSQDFSGGLSANESVFGNFSVNGGAMGHAGSYGDNEYSYYELSVDLSGHTGASMQFTYSAHFEQHFDRFNVLASSGAITPPSGLLTPTSGMTYEDQLDVHRPELGAIAFDTSVENFGTAIFDLSAFDGDLLTLRFQFGSDGSVTSSGFRMDDLIITADGTDVPEPAAIGLLVLGLAGLGLARRRR